MDFHEAVRVFSVARDLVDRADRDPSGSGIQSEYERALVEMTAGLLGVSTDYKDELARLIWG